MIGYICLAIGIVFLVIYLIKNKSKPSTLSTPVTEKQKEPVSKPQKINYDRLRIYFGSQTGTAAKLSQSLAEEATQQGFEPQVIDLKDLTIDHFKSTNQISIFMLSNTGEGESPENCVKFMAILAKKQDLDEKQQINWKKINYSVFGLGNSQYQHFNKVGIDADSLLQKNGSNRIYKIGLGDDNASMEDDFTEWKSNLWQTLKKFRVQNPLIKSQDSIGKSSHIIQNTSQMIDYVSKQKPTLANFRLAWADDRFSQQNPISQEFLDFKTKASLTAQQALVENVHEIRQNTQDGSTLSLEISFKHHPEYQTAGNIALYSKNDPAIVREVIQYFNIDAQNLQRSVYPHQIKQDKALRLNFAHNKLRSILEQSINLQQKLSKSTLKKLSKFQSKNSNYFTQNSLKTTEEFKRITQKQWYYLIKIIKEFEVKLTIQDFIELSDSMAPRLFTIASHYKTQKNVIVAASIVQNGLISKYFLTQPKKIKAELRKSTFTDAMKWQKVIFVSAGTGFAPFRGYIQQKEYRLSKKQPTPIISLYFGCKHENGDFIYRQELLRWKERGIIERLQLAFSRDTQKKVYVQNLLEQEQAELKQLEANDKSAIYICGSLQMGHSIIEVLTKSFGNAKVKEMDETGRIVKQLW